MTKTTSKPKPKKHQKRILKMSDGTVMEVNDLINKEVRRGETGRNDYNKEVPDIEEVLPEPADEMAAHKYPPPRKDPLFRARWGRFIDNVVSRENFKPGHLDTLEILCDLYVEMDFLNAFLRKNGMFHDVTTIMGKTRRAYPEVAQRDKVRAQIQQYSRHLDLFPKKDKALGGVGSGEDDEWA
jgi:phage terminase small subunit